MGWERGGGLAARPVGSGAGALLSPQPLPASAPGGTSGERVARSRRHARISPRFCGQAGGSRDAFSAPSDPQIVPVLCRRLGAGGARRVCLGFSPAFRSRPLLCLGLGRWLFVAAPRSDGFAERSGWDGGRAQALFCPTSWGTRCVCVPVPGRGAGHFPERTATLNTPSSPAGSAWQCLSSVHSPACQAWCSLLRTQAKTEPSFLLLPPSWGLGWDSPPSRKNTLEVKLLLVTGRATSISKKV